MDDLPADAQAEPNAAGFPVMRGIGAVESLKKPAVLGGRDLVTENGPVPNGAKLRTLSGGRGTGGALERDSSKGTGLRALQTASKPARAGQGETAGPKPQRHARPPGPQKEC
jgi:hypothetical protein